MLFVFACAPTEDSAAAPAEAVVPLAGDWAVTQGATWAGDCKLDDMASNYRDETWTLDPRGDHLDIFRGYWVIQWCELGDGTFTCDEGSEVYDYGEQGVATLTKTLAGTFPDAATLSGAHTIEAACEGEICADIADSLGKHFAFPCSVTAAVAGSYVGG